MHSKMEALNSDRRAFPFIDVFLTGNISTKITILQYIKRTFILKINVKSYSSSRNEIFHEFIECSEFLCVISTKSEDVPPTGGFQVFFRHSVSNLPVDSRA